MPRKTRKEAEHNLHQKTDGVDHTKESLLLTKGNKDAFTAQKEDPQVKLNPVSPTPRKKSRLPHNETQKCERQYTGLSVESAGP